MIFYITGVERALVWGVLMVGLSSCRQSAMPHLARRDIMCSGTYWQGLPSVFRFVVISSWIHAAPILLGHDIQMHSLLIFYQPWGNCSFWVFGFVLGLWLLIFFGQLENVSEISSEELCPGTQDRNPSELQ
jgi:hypothetical protein